MMGTPEGSRVGAIRSEEAGTVNFFGYGVYVGRKPCPHLDGIHNPKIELDDGGVVWGCESWWGPEEQIRERIEGLTIVKVSPSAVNTEVAKP
jgi:hypothetical protein